jgi:hypothetical protein
MRPGDARTVRWSITSAATLLRSASGSSLARHCAHRELHGRGVWALGVGREDQQCGIVVQRVRGGLDHRVL